MGWDGERMGAGGWRCGYDEGRREVVRRVDGRE